MNDCTVSALTVEVKTGPKIATAAQSLSVEAYEKIDVTVPGVDPNDKTKPGTGTAVVLPSGSTAQFVMITSTVYGSGLTYTPGSKGSAIVLDQPLLLSGGAVSLLSGLDTVTISNNTGQNATVTILIGRTAQPPQSSGSGGGGTGGSTPGGGSGGGSTPPA